MQSGVGLAGCVSEASGSPCSGKALELLAPYRTTAPEFSVDC